MRYYYSHFKERKLSLRAVPQGPTFSRCCQRGVWACVVFTTRFPGMGTALLKAASLQQAGGGASPLHGRVRGTTLAP